MATRESLFRRSFSTSAQFTKDQVLDILFYVKQIFGLVLGILVPLLGIMGLPGVIAFAAGCSALSYLYVYKYLGVDDEVVESKDVLKQHFMNGLFPFLLSWVIVYNLRNFS